MTLPEPDPYGEPESIWQTPPPAQMTAPDGWPVLHREALHGPAGAFVRLVGPHTESDPAALLVTFLTVVGASMSVDGGLHKMPHAVADAAMHPARLATVIVGDTAKARKGTSFENVRRVLSHAPSVAMLLDSGTVDGFGSGEALVDHAAERVGPDVLDGRVLVYEPEFARVLSVCGREGSTLSSILRNAWDGRTLAVRSRTKTTTAEGASVSILGHITVEELRATLTGTDAANGYANRHLFCLARRSKLLPHGGEPDEDGVLHLAGKVEESLSLMNGVGRMKRTPEADAAWERVYSALAADDPGGLVGAVTARAEAQVLRLSVVYAALDSRLTIGVEHLQAAWAVWRYCRHSAQMIFGGRTGDSRTERVLAFVRAAGADGVTGTEIHRHLGNNCTSQQRAVVLAQLEEAGLVTSEVVKPEGPGRPSTVTRATPWAVHDASSPLPAFTALLRTAPPGPTRPPEAHK